MISINVDFSQLDELQQKLIEFPRAEMLSIATTHILGDIREKTRQGINPQGTRFAPYAPRTVKERKRLGLPTDRVDLRRTGELLDQMHRENDLITVTTDKLVIAGALNFGVPKHNLPARPFLAEPGKDTIQKIEQDGVTQIQKIIVRK